MDLEYIAKLMKILLKSVDIISIRVYYNYRKKEREGYKMKESKIYSKNFELKDKGLAITVYNRFSKSQKISACMLYLNPIDKCFTVEYSYKR